MAAVGSDLHHREKLIEFNQIYASILVVRKMYLLLLNLVAIWYTLSVMCGTWKHRWWCDLTECFAWDITVYVCLVVDSMPDLIKLFYIYYVYSINSQNWAFAFIARLFMCVHSFPEIGSWLLQNIWAKRVLLLVRIFNFSLTPFSILFPFSFNFLLWYVPLLKIVYILTFRISVDTWHTKRMKNREKWF